MLETSALNLISLEDEDAHRILPFPRIGTRRKLRKLLLPDNDATKVDPYKNVRQRWKA